MPPQSLSLPYSRSFYHWCNSLNTKYYLRLGLPNLYQAWHTLSGVLFYITCCCCQVLEFNITVDVLSCISMLSASPSLLSIQITWTKLNIHACSKAAMVQVFQKSLPVKSTNKKKSINWDDKFSFTEIFFCFVFRC